jgi:hypothetical protein
MVLVVGLINAGAISTSFASPVGTFSGLTISTEATASSMTAPATSTISEPMSSSPHQLQPQFKLYKTYGFSSEAEMRKYFTISKFKITREPTPSLLSSQIAVQLFSNPTTSTPATDPISVISDIIGVDLTQWITLGQKVWQVIVENSAVANVSTQRISVLPAAQQNWLEMENWRGPAVHTFTLSAQNGFGATVISHTYTLAFNYGGQLGGKGAFIANATMIPTAIDVSWGFKLNSKLEVGEPVNMGSKESPRPGVELSIKWDTNSIIGSPLKGTESFFIKGDGTAMNLTSGV